MLGKYLYKYVVFVMDTILERLEDLTLKYILFILNVFIQLKVSFIHKK